jgi:uncharacterized protein
MHHPVSWWELASADEPATTEFLKTVFGWQLGGGADVGYWEALAGKADNGFFGGGIYQRNEQSHAPLILYITVDDVDALAQKVLEYGGRVIDEPCDVKGLGRLAVIADPSGQPFGIIKRSF